MMIGNIDSLIDARRRRIAWLIKRYLNKYLSKRKLKAELRYILDPPKNISPELLGKWHVNVIEYADSFGHI
jgi:hypothetical protein